MSNQYLTEISHNCKRSKNKSKINDNLKNNISIILASGTPLGRLHKILILCPLLVPAACLQYCL